MNEKSIKGALLREFYIICNVSLYLLFFFIVYRFVGLVGLLFTFMAYALYMLTKIMFNMELLKDKVEEESMVWKTIMNIRKSF